MTWMDVLLGYGLGAFARGRSALYRGCGDDPRKLPGRSMVRPAADTWRSWVRGGSGAVGV